MFKIVALFAEDANGVTTVIKKSIHSWPNMFLDVPFLKAVGLATTLHKISPQKKFITVIEAGLEYEAMDKHSASAAKNIERYGYAFQNGNPTKILGPYTFTVNEHPKDRVLLIWFRKGKWDK